jgi:hypothetical protein
MRVGSLVEQKRASLLQQSVKYRLEILQGLILEFENLIV